MKTLQQRIDQHSKSIVCRWMASVVAAAALTVGNSTGWTADVSQSLRSPPTTGDTKVVVDRKTESQATEPKARSPKPLPRPTDRTLGAAPSWNGKLPRPSGQTFIVLGIVAGLALVWRLTRGGERNLPSDLVEVYGRVPLNPKQHLHLVRVGNTLLVLIESAQGLQRLAEITDPDEVQNITRRFRKDGTGVVPPELSNVVSAGRHLASFRSA